MRVDGKSFTIHGGYCGSGHRGTSGHTRWLWFGLINGSSSQSAPESKGLSLVLSPGDRPGDVKVADAIVQVTGQNLGAFGSATIAKGLKGGTFAVVGVPVAEHFTGSWSCG